MQIIIAHTQLPAAMQNTASKSAVHYTVLYSVRASKDHATL